jgi:hypothetical protein
VLDTEKAVQIDSACEAATEIEQGALRIAVPRTADAGASA